MELFRFLGIKDDARRAGIRMPDIRMYKLPGGTEPTRTWNPVIFKPSPDRPEASSRVWPSYSEIALNVDALPRTHWRWAST